MPTVVYPYLEMPPAKCLAPDEPFPNFTARFHRFIQERISMRIAIPTVVVERVQFQFEQDHIADALVMSLETWLLRGENTQLETGSYVVPASWWDYFKLEKFPAWMLRRFPAKFVTHSYTYEKHIHVCPHADVAWPDPRHIRFMERTVGHNPSGS